MSRPVEITVKVLFTTELIDAAGYVIAIELDDRLIPTLRTKFALHDIHEDILKVDIKSIVDESYESLWTYEDEISKSTILHVTTPIITKLIESKARFGKPLLL